ncbi:MAG: type II toxin-antitoxin system TacA family antitoxin [Thermomicrobiales bacterium]
MATETHNERIEVRVPASVKAEFVRAAEMEGRSTSDLLIEYIRRATDEIFARHRRIILASADWDVFTEALTTPPEPGPVLTRAATRYRERYGT